MKTLLFFLCYLSCSTTRADHQSYQKLAEVNQCWTEQKDIPALPAYDNRSEKDWIRMHLSLVEKVLRGRDQSQWNAAQKANRARCLDILHRYWQEGHFPVNDCYAYRTPIFIDDYNNFCAVGFLLKETGFEAVSRRISAQTNLAYVRQMNYPELTKWAGAYGFSVDELAWIQPTYPPRTSVKRLGAGVDGIVHELYVDKGAEKMYVGGSFVQVDGAITVNNIAYVTEASGVYTWHRMGSGVNGKVNAIEKFNDKIFVAGSFDKAGGKTAANIAYWNGSDWAAAGCINGTVFDLLVFEGTLYAAGEFKSCLGTRGGNFAQWNGTEWKMIPRIAGRINTIEPNGSAIVLGGAFTYDTITNVMQWSPSTSFTPFLNSIRNEVMDFDVYKDVLYAACKRADKADTNEVLLKLEAGKWEQGFRSRREATLLQSRSGAIELNTLCPEEGSLNIGGSFSLIPAGIGIRALNTYSMGSTANWSIVDSTVNKMVLFKGELYFGGVFKNGSGYWGRGIEVVSGLNGIAKRIENPAHADELAIPRAGDLANELRIFPNPTKGNSFVSVENNINADTYTLYELNGKTIESGKLQDNGTLQVPSVAAGLYFLDLSNGEGASLRCKIMIE